MDSKTQSININEETAMETKPENLFQWCQQMSKKYPNEKLWNVLSRWVMDYQDTFTTIRRTLANIQLDAERDIENMNNGYEPMSLSLNSNAERLAQTRIEMRDLSDKMKSLLYVIEIDKEDDQLFWDLVTEYVKNPNGGK